VVEVKECANDELLREGLTAEFACSMVKSVVVMRIQRSCKALLLKARTKVELAVGCDGCETQTSTMEHEALLC
jgi:hypothetical protein